ncbi:hypothetical protein SDC9_133097 [bioreactor metagenome]|uniref:RNA polymerase sigma factor 70 region 4 type 2 domain-containing protein n=1 Tax=bioreactor metagenome TaxID=1076179 RepID=A0A645D9K1_9ZZZZ|nr:RNA polymerase sigma factor [Oscillospiraceae bacterium]
MEDEPIVRMYLARDEEAIRETQKKYGNYLNRISQNILQDTSDSEECVNDTYLAAWNSIPPHRPEILRTYLGKLTRRISLDCIRKKYAGKRRGGDFELSVDELEDCLPASGTLYDEIENARLGEVIGRYLYGLPKDKRRMFVCRYWHSYSVKEISEVFGISETKAANVLYRIRKDLKTYLESEDLFHG